MKLLRYCGLIAALATVSPLAQPAAAAQRSEPSAVAGSAFTAFSLRGSDSYSVEVLTVGRHRVILSVSKGQVGALYSVRGRIARDGIHARFGNLGRIAVAFHPSTPARAGKSRQRCGRAALATETGTFRGTIEFAGERDYTTVDAGRAQGFVVKPVRVSCAGRRAKASATFPVPGLTTHLTALSRKRGRTVSFEVYGFRRSRRMSVQASSQERRGKMSIFRAASATIGGSNAFSASEIDAHPAFATLKPPKPFSGSGTFQEHADSSHSWTGTLAAWLPGIGKLSLAGPSFASNLCRQPPGAAGCDLFPTVRRRPWIAQGSGSQSQAFWDARLSWSR